MKKRVLFICHGNICRSPMAEFVMKDLIHKKGLSGQIEVSSCATSREELGHDTHRGTKQKLTQMGIPFQPRRAVQLKEDDYNEYHYLIPMDQNNLRNIKKIIPADPENKINLLLSFAGEGRDIADPWYTGNFDKTYDDILAGCKALLEHIMKEN